MALTRTTDPAAPGAAHTRGPTRRRPDAPYRPRPAGWRRWAPWVATAACVVGVIAITLWQLQLPLLFHDTSTTGGDTGAHYMLPQYLKSTLLTHGQLTGWDPAWYDGFPLYTYYFVLPDLWAALTSYVIGYDVAFKLATVLGSVTLPVCAWAMGRLFGLRRPVPAVLAVATLPYLFDYTWTIYGGNLFSTLAGEYAYSLSISLALLFIGLFAYGLRTGRHRGVTAVVLALCIAAHIVPAMFALAGAVVLTLFELVPARWRPHDDLRRPFAARRHPPDRWWSAALVARRRPRWWADGGKARATLGALWPLWWGGTTAGLGLLLSGWWLVPFGLEGAYANSMGYQNVTTWAALLWPVADRWVVVLALVSTVLAFVTMSRIGLTLSVLGGLSIAALVLDPQGSLYNVRFLPLVFLCVYLLAGWGFGTAAVGVARGWRRWRLSSWALEARRALGTGTAPPPRPRVPVTEPAAVGGALVALLGACLVVVPPFLVTDGVLPAGALPVTVGAQVSDWAHYNYIGYEGQAAYPELVAIENMMRRAGETDGCGRAMWEYNADEDRFGTPEALMLLPYWTNGCIDSMEGLLFESSPTVPYHFLNQSELSLQPSDPMVGLDYGPLNVPLGVEHLQLLGVRYFLASSPAVQQAADADPSLVPIDRIGPFRQDYDDQELDTTWELYLVKDSSLVTPLRDRPVVMTGVGAGQSSWLPPSEAWYLDPAEWSVERAAAGPPGWTRAGPSAPVAKVPEPPTTVTDIRTTDSSVSFHVSRTGTPVLVKISYFPNWQAQGADGPWRVTPNLMVVVPTAHDVSLTYGTSRANEIGQTLTALGVLGVAVPWVLARRRRRRAS